MDQTSDNGSNMFAQYAFTFRSPIPWPKLKRPLSPSNEDVAAPPTKLLRTSELSVVPAHAGESIRKEKNTNNRGQSLASEASSLTMAATLIKEEPQDFDPREDPMYPAHAELLQRYSGVGRFDDIQTSPIFTAATHRHAERMLPSSSPSKSSIFTQYGLLGGDVASLAVQRDPTAASARTTMEICQARDSVPLDPRVFYNVAAPSSVFICGSQGSGKSHTLSTLLENALISDKATLLPRPLSALVFHYDNFYSDTTGSPCEAAFLSSNPKVKARVLCAPTNYRSIAVSPFIPFAHFVLIFDCISSHFPFLPF
jgi:hypothetical protein